MTSPIDSVLEAILASERRRERQRRNQIEPTPIEFQISTMRESDGLAATRGTVVRGRQQTRLSSEAQRDLPGESGLFDTNTTSKTPPLPSGAPVDDAVQGYHHTGEF